MQKNSNTKKHAEKVKDVEAGEPLRRARARILLREIDRLRANQVPGRCGECTEYSTEPNLGGHRGVCQFYMTPKEPREFCNEFTPKEKRDE